MIYIWSSKNNILFFIYLDLGTFYRDNKLFPESLEFLNKALNTVSKTESEKAEGLKFIALHNEHL